MAEYWCKTGDTLPRIESTLTDGQGNPIDIAQCDIAFTMRPIGSSVAVVNLQPASNDQVTDGSDGTKGFVHYDWQPGDTDLAGGYDAEWQVEFNNGGIMTFPNSGFDSIAIVGDLENA